jgi:hypothetical protein
MRFRLLILSILMALPRQAMGAEAAGTTRPSPDEKQLKLEAQAEIVADMRDKPFIGEKDFSDIISFDTRDGRLVPSTSLPVMEPSYAKLKGTGGWAKIQVIGGETLHVANGGHFLQQFAYRDLSVAGNVEIRTEVDFNYQRLSVTRWTGYADDGMLSVQLIETAAPGPESVVLYIQNVSAAAPSAQRRLFGPSLADLYLNHPSDVNQYLRPIFRTLRQEQVVFRPDEHWAYQALEELIPIDPAIPPKVEAAVKELDADSYAEREAAMVRLRALGAAAAVELMRDPPRNLTPEQSVRVDAFLAPFHPLPVEQIKRLRADPDFLLDCQFCSDAQIRRAAAEQFRRAGFGIVSVDEKASGPELGDALARLRPDR